MENGPFVLRGNLLYKIPEGSSRSMFDLREKKPDEGDSKQTLNTQASESDLTVANSQEIKLKFDLGAFVKSRISQTLASMKMFLNFNPEEQQNFE
jgi:hypothetical protein